MCVPCAAAAPELLPFLLMLIFGILAVVGVVLVRVLPAAGIAAAVLACFGYRWLSGAVIRKSLGESDEAYWARAKASPRYTRGVRASARLALTTTAVGVLAWPLATVLIASSLVVTGIGFKVRADLIRARAESTNRARIEGRPIRVYAQIGQR